MREQLDATETALRLEIIANQIRSWLDWHKSGRDKEFLVTDGDTSIMALPVPMWTNHAQFENWIKTIREARAALIAAEQVRESDEPGNAELRKKCITKLATHCLSGFQN